MFPELPVSMMTKVWLMPSLHCAFRSLKVRRDKTKSKYGA
jgi:hypothetical protein